MGAIDRTNPASTIPAGMTAEIANNAANLLSDISPAAIFGAEGAGCRASLSASSPGHRLHAAVPSAFPPLNKRACAQSPIVSNTRHARCVAVKGVGVHLHGAQ
jgi:hypothetical protein